MIVLLPSVVICRSSFRSTPSSDKLGHSVASPMVSKEASGQRVAPPAVSKNASGGERYQPRNTGHRHPFKRIVCYHCGEAGHIQPRCPKRKATTTSKTVQMVKVPERQESAVIPDPGAEGSSSRVALLVEHPVLDESLEWCKDFLHP